MEWNKINMHGIFFDFFLMCFYFAYFKVECMFRNSELRGVLLRDD